MNRARRKVGPGICRVTMSTIQRLLLLVTVLVVVGGVVFLMTWDIPPPTAHIERVIPDEELPK